MSKGEFNDGFYVLGGSTAVVPQIPHTLKKLVEFMI